MVRISLYRDVRSASSDRQPAPIKVRIGINRTAAFISTDIKATNLQWDGETERIVAHPDAKRLNIALMRQRLTVEEAIEMIREGRSLKSLTASELKSMIERSIGGVGEDTREDLFACRMSEYIKNARRDNTRALYRQTENKMREYDSDYSALSFEDIDKRWLTGFARWMTGNGLALNSQNIHLRNIRAVFNAAIDEGITSNYPFRKLRAMKTERTAKRAMSLDDIRLMMSFNPEPYAKKYIDAFRLIFMLCGINIVDLCSLTGIRDGRIEYRRAKTGRLYSIKVEPEALSIINKYRGNKTLLSFSEGAGGYESFYRLMDRALKNVAEADEVEYRGNGHKKVRTPLFPEVTTYWARHTWATMAASLDIPKETIAAALGHGGNTVTDIYIDFDQKKIDEANRRVLDWVLYGKK